MLIAPRVLWPERVALVAVAVVAGASVFLWLVLSLSVGTLGDIKLDRAALGWLLDTEAGLVLPLWLGLRAVHIGIDLVRRRRSSRSRQTRPDDSSGFPRIGA
jgi:hypothetical protein